MFTVERSGSLEIFRGGETGHYSNMKLCLLGGMSYTESHYAFQKNVEKTVLPITSKKGILRTSE